jgi:transcriptional regulator with XRE-family HTH domain
MKKRKPGPSKGKKHTQISRSPLGERLYRVRRARGLTQEQLGELTGLSKRMIAHYEVGSKAMTVDSLKKIAVSLGVAISHLLGEKSTPPDLETGIKPSIRKRLDTLKELPAPDQQAIFRMIDNAAKKDEEIKVGAEAAQRT